MKKGILAILVSLSMSISAIGQTSTVQEEQVEGIGNVLGFFGKKLTKELGTRLNLESGDTVQVEMVPTKVRVKVGPFSMVRTEYRPKKKK